MIKGGCKEEITALRIIRELLIEHEKGDMSDIRLLNELWNIIVKTESVYLGTGAVKGMAEQAKRDQLTRAGN